MIYNPTQKQHVLPLASIKRFYCSKENGAHVHFIASKKECFLKANNHTFVAERKWDENIERAVSELKQVSNN